VAGCDSMGIAGEMEIDFLHRNDLGMSPSCPASFDAKHRSKGWLPKRHNSALAKSAQSHRQPDRRCRLTFSQWGGINGGHENIAALRPGLQSIQRRQCDFSLVPSVRRKFFRR
jgi:hypothetical protein